MASQFNPIAALVQDDTGTPDAPNGDGTQINSSLFQAIDAILNEFITRSTKTVGGVWSWETLGIHNFTGGGVGVNRVAVRNSVAGSANRAELELQVDTSTVVQLQKFAGNHTATGAVTADGARLVLSSAVPTAVLSFETVSTAGFQFWPGGSKLVTIDTTNGAVAENGFGWSVKNSAGFVVPSMTISASNVINIGSDNAAGVNDAIIGGGTGIRFRVNSAERALIDDTRPEMLLGGTTVGAFQSCQIGSGTASPVSAQILFGTDGTGWQLRFGKNQAGSVTYLWKLSDGGHLSPITNNVYDIGTSGERIANGYLTNINVTGNILPNADNTAGLGDSTHRFASLYAMDARFNDVSFANEWSITEGDKVGLGEGLAFLTRAGDLAMYIDVESNLYVKDIRSLSGLLPYFKRTTREERNVS